MTPSERPARSWRPFSAIPPSSAAWAAIARTCALSGSAERTCSSSSTALPYCFSWIQEKPICWWMRGARSGRSASRAAYSARASANRPSLYAPSARSRAWRASGLTSAAGRLLELHLERRQPARLAGQAHAHPAAHVARELEVDVPGAGGNPADRPASLLVRLHGRSPAALGKLELDGHADERCARLVGDLALHAAHSLPVLGVGGHGARRGLRRRGSGSDGARPSSWTASLSSQ